MKALQVKSRKAAPRTTGLPRVLPEIRTLIDASRQHVVSTANLTLVWLYWNVGRGITQDIQKNQKRAGYGEQLIEQLSQRLARDYGRGFSAPNLWDMKRYFEAFKILQAVPRESGSPEILQTPFRESRHVEILPAPLAESREAGICQPLASKSASTQILQPLAREFSKAGILPPAAAESSPGQIRSALSGKSTPPDILQTLPVKSEDRLTIDFTKHSHLGWTHYRMLLGVEAGLKRGFYLEQAASQRWSKRELQRQIDRALVRLEKARGPAETVRYEDAFKDPYLLDFLGLKGAYSEKDLEAAILANLQQFLTELGSDFCFIRRQFPMRIDDEDYWLDLLFYHRGLRCLVAVDLKIGPFIAADKGQMDLYLAWLKRHEWRQDVENEPVGLILCTSKKRQHVELLLGSGPHKMQVSEYLTRLPSKHLLAERLKIYSRLLKDVER